jgi:hypothetical protein
MLESKHRRNGPTSLTSALNTIDEALGLLREATGHARLRAHYQKGTPEYDAAAHELNKALYLARIATDLSLVLGGE